jgi:hypothetical protein
MKNLFSFGYREEIKTTCNNSLHGLVVCLLPGEKYNSVMLKYFSLNDTPCRFYMSTDKIIWSHENGFLFNLLLGMFPDNCIKIAAKRFNNIYPTK